MPTFIVLNPSDTLRSRSAICCPCSTWVSRRAFRVRVCAFSSCRNSDTSRSAAPASTRAAAESWRTSTTARSRRSTRDSRSSRLDTCCSFSGGTGSIVAHLSGRWQPLTAQFTRTCVLCQEGIHEGFRLEWGKVIRPFPEADQLHRDAQLTLHLEHDPALGRAVELGEHDARHVHYLGEHARLRQTVLPGRRVEHQQDLGGLGLLLHDVPS